MGYVAIKNIEMPSVDDSNEMEPVTMELNQKYYFVSICGQDPYSYDKFRVTCTKYQMTHTQIQQIQAGNAFETIEEANEFCDGLNKTIDDYMQQWKQKKLNKASRKRNNVKSTKRI